MLFFFLLWAHGPKYQNLWAGLGLGLTFESGDGLLVWAGPKISWAGLGQALNISAYAVL